MTLGLLAKLLNPLEALELKIKKLLGEGTDAADLAERFGSTGGKVRQLQDVAQSLGVTPDKFKDMLMKYAEAIEKGREEIANPFLEKSDATVALKEFLKEKDIVKSFTDFMLSLKSEGMGPGSDVALSDRAKRMMSRGTPLTPDERDDLLTKGELRARTGLETRHGHEKTIFGEVQYGAARKLIEANIPGEAKNLHLPSEDILTQKVNKAANLQQKKQALDVTNSTQDFVNATTKLNGKMIQDMAKSDKVELDKQTEELDNYAMLKRSSTAIEEIKTGIEKLNKTILEMLAFFAPVDTSLKKISDARIMKDFPTDIGRSWK
jgi:hypothetical protein